MRYSILALALAAQVGCQNTNRTAPQFRMNDLVMPAMPHAGGHDDRPEASSPGIVTEAAYTNCGWTYHVTYEGSAALLAEDQLKRVGRFDWVTMKGTFDKDQPQPQAQPKPAEKK